MARIRYRLYLMAPNVVFQALVNQPVAINPSSIITYDNVSVGAYTDVMPEMLCRVGPTAGSDAYGRVRMRKAPAPPALLPGWYSDAKGEGSLYQVDNAVIEVLDLYRPWSKTPRVEDDGTIYMDYDRSGANWVYGDNYLPPVPILNCGVALQEDLAGGVATFAIDADDSYVTDGESTSISSVAWTLPSGASLTSGTLSSSAIEFEMDEGADWLRCTVTEDHGVSQDRLVWCIAGRPAANEVLVNAVSVVRTRQGSRLSVRALQDVPLDTYPNGTLGVLVNPDATGVDRVVFAGWHVSDNTKAGMTDRGFISTTTLEFEDLGLWLQRLGALPTTIERTNSGPANWLHIYHADPDRAMVRILAEHCNALLFADFHWSGLGATYYPFPGFALPGKSIADQLDFVAFAIRHSVTCNKYGILQALPNPQRLDHPTETPSVATPITRTTTVQAALTDADVISDDSTNAWYPEDKWTWGDFLLASTADAPSANPQDKYALAPGRAPRAGTGEQTVSRQIAVNTAEALAVTGHDDALANNRDRARKFTLTPGHDIDPASMTWVTRTNSAATAGERGEVLTAARYLPVEFSFTHDGERQTQDESLTAEREVIGQPATEIIYPESGVPQVPLIWRRTASAPAPGNGLKAGLDNILYAGAKGVTWTADHTATTPTWDSATWFDIGIQAGELGGWFVSSPWSPAYLGTGESVNGWLLTAWNIYKVTDIFGDKTLTPLYALPYPMAIAQSTGSYNFSWSNPNFIQTQWGVNGWVMACYTSGNVTDGYKAICVYSKDGANFQTAVVGSFAARSGYTAFTQNPDSFYPGEIYMSSKRPGVAYCAWPVTSGTGENGGDYIVKKTSNYGATWSTFTGGSADPTYWLRTLPPYTRANNGVATWPDETIAYSSLWRLTLPQRPYLYRSNGASITDVTHIEVVGPSTYQWGPYHRFGVAASVYDPLKCAGVFRRSEATSNYLALYTTTDGWATHSRLTTPGVDPDYQSVQIAGDDDDVLYLFGDTMKYSTNFGTTVATKGTDISDTYQPYQVFGGAS